MLIEQFELGCQNDAVIGIKIGCDLGGPDRVSRTSTKKNGILGVKAAQTLRLPMSRLSIPSLQDTVEDVLWMLFHRMNLLT